MTQDRDILYLVDGSSYIYRAYHAIRHLSNSKGFPTNAIFGFCKMILKLFDEKNPKYIAIVFDTKEPTFRHELYEAYKATRPPMPEDLVAQLPYIKEFVMSLNVAMLEKTGLLFVGDCKMSAWATRVHIHASQQHYLTPLALV